MQKWNGPSLWHWGAHLQCCDKTSKNTHQGPCCTGSNKDGLRVWKWGYCLYAGLWDHNYFLGDLEVLQGDKDFDFDLDLLLLELWKWEVLNITYWKKNCQAMAVFFCTGIKTYHIAGNFRGRKLSQIDEKSNFRRKNFRGLLTFATPKNATPLKFRKKTFANWWKIQFSQRKLSWIAHFCHAKECYPPKISRENFRE